MVAKDKNGKPESATGVSRKGSTLINRNVTLHGRRTSLRLESEMWDALGEIAARERATLHQLCERIDKARSESSLTAGVRVFILSYFRVAASESGHLAAGHGDLPQA